MPSLHQATLILLLFLFFSFAPALQGQAPDARRDSAVAKLRTGQQIRISAEGIQRLVGRAGVAANDTLDVAQDDMVRRIPVPAIDTLWVRGGHAKTGAIIGGSLLGAMATALYVGLASDSDSGSEGVTGVKTVGSFLFGATVGVVIGGIIGGSAQDWKQSFP